MKILFLDDRPQEIKRLWANAGCQHHELLPVEKFESVESTLTRIELEKPDIIFIGYGLGHLDITGKDVVIAIREKGFQGLIIANSGGTLEQFAGVEVDGEVKRNPAILCQLIDRLSNQ